MDGGVVGAGAGAADTPPVGPDGAGCAVAPAAGAYRWRSGGGRVCAGAASSECAHGRASLVPAWDLLTALWTDWCGKACYHGGGRPCGSLSGLR